jgi:RNA polymerase sigma factor (TIGR02999 family)
MNQITRILSAIEQGDPKATEQLLPLVYDELRKLAAAKLARMGPGQTLQPTALVHEAYLRLVDTGRASSWNSRGHFFVAAAEAMRRILVEHIRRKRTSKHGGHLTRVDAVRADIAAPETPDDLIALDEALKKLEASRPKAAEVVKLRYFCGMTIAKVAVVLGIPTRTVDRLWSYARVWLLREIRGGDQNFRDPSPHSSRKCHL